MDNDRDLLPWILGGLSIASVAVAVAVVGASRPLPDVAPSALQPKTQPLPTVALAPSVAPASPPQSSAVPDPVQNPATTAPMAASGQIWACTTNGQKTFSNNPCGDKSSLLDLGPVNTMDRAPLYRSARDYSQGASYPAPGYLPSYGDTDSQDSGDTGYSSVVAVPVFVRPNPPRTHRPFDHAGAARKY